MTGLIRLGKERQKMRKTAKELWEESEKGTLFACKFVPEPEDDLDGSAEVIWEKGVVDTLEWSDVLWITPITHLGGRVYG